MHGANGFAKDYPKGDAVFAGRDRCEEERLDELTKNRLFEEARPTEKLFDNTQDPVGVPNLSAEPKHKATPEAMREKLQDREGKQGR
jgi:hypothetical protein